MQKFSSNSNKTTTVIGSFDHDLKGIFHIFNTPVQKGRIDEIIHGFSQGNKGGFNFLNVSEEVYLAGKHSRSSFFNSVNAVWIDEAVKRGDDILVVSSRRFMRNADGTLTGFGKEVQRLIDVHGYRWNSDYTRLLPPGS